MADPDRKLVADGTASEKRDESGAANPEPAVGSTRSFPVVGIGASAGGLEALRLLLEAMPDEPELALVVIQHLDPTRKSLAPELLSRYTRMPVCQVEDEPRVQPNRVYLIPPGKYLAISAGELHLSEPDQPRGARMAIDFFLRSLARNRPHCSVAVILSGTGTDGTLGIKAVKAAGGLVIAQDPVTAEHPGMPRSAIATGAVDHILPPDSIPDMLVRYAQHPYVRDGAGVAPAEEEEDVAEVAPDGLNALLALLRIHAKQDFRNYKEQMLARRARRRMCLHHIDDFDGYVQYLREHPREIAALARDLLISVTDFFRDPEAWEPLRQAIAPIIAGKADDALIRVWTPGCATGEEPYSVAMLILDDLRRAEKICPLQIFASDIDKAALDYARAGRYPKSIEADVSAQRLDQFFTAEDGDDYYQLKKALREAVLFAEQNLIGDPPFSKLDLICCRNLLIYLKPDVQEKVIALFHFALNEGGVLFLGSAETIAGQTDLFQTLDKRWRIFRRVGPTHPGRVDIPLTTSGRRREIDMTPAQPLRRETRLTHLAQQQLLNLLCANAVLIDHNWRILYICGEVGPYVTRKSGMPSDHLLDNARRGLRTKLRGAVHEALSGRKTVSVTASVQRDSVFVTVVVTVRAIRDPEQKEDLALVVFEEGAPGPARRAGHPEDGAAGTLGTDDTTRRSPRPAEPSAPDIEAASLARQLEEEMAQVKDDLQATVEQLQAANEEHKAANEEVMSTNEELQTTNEELETSKVELQSLNEELSTVNNQLAAKVEEVETKHADLVNLIAVTNAPTVCLDTDLAVRWFTPPAQEVLRLKTADMGRPLTDLAHDFCESDLVQVAQRVLADPTPVEDEVACRDGRTFLRRVTPYRADGPRISGVVITFWDITRRKRDERALREIKEFSDRIIETVREAILVLDKDLHVIRANASFYRCFQVLPAETEGRLVFCLGDNQWDIPALRQLLEDVLPKHSAFSDYEVEHDFEAIGRKTMLLNARQVDHQDLILLAIEDVSERKQAADALKQLNESLEQKVATRTQALHESEESLQAILNTAADSIITFDRCGTIERVNPATERMFGYAADELIGQNVKLLMPMTYLDERNPLARYLQTPAKGTLGISQEVEARRKDGSNFPVELALSEVEPGKHWTGILRDISRRKELECEVVETASLEQRRIGQDLHDTVGQEITALNLLVTDLAETVRTDPAAALRLVERMAQGLQRGQQELRAVLRGLLPVQVDTEGLMAALADLAGRTQQEGRASCTFDCPEPVAVADHLTATHLYLIVQEAVHNAVKHAQPRNIGISLESHQGLILRVRDDGIGHASSRGESEGLGLRIMRDRAAIIGATLTIEPVEPTGTLVTCALARRNNE